MDYISHHALHSHIPIHHYTNHTAVTIHSLALIVSPHLHVIHSHTFKQHSHMHSRRSLVLAPADISERYSSCYLCVWPRTAGVKRQAQEFTAVWVKDRAIVCFLSTVSQLFSEEVDWSYTETELSQSTPNPAQRGSGNVCVCVCVCQRCCRRTECQPTSPDTLLLCQSILNYNNLLSLLCLIMNLFSTQYRHQDI